MKLHKIVYVMLKNHYRLGAAPDLAGGAYDASPNPLVGWEEVNPLNAFGVSLRHLRRLKSDVPPKTIFWIRSCILRLFILFLH